MISREKKQRRKVTEKENKLSERERENITNEKKRTKTKENENDEYENKKSRETMATTEIIDSSSDIDSTNSDNSVRYS